MSWPRKNTAFGASDIHELKATFVPFTAQTRMSGVDIGKRSIRKGAAESIEAYVKEQGGKYPEDVRKGVDSISRLGGTPLVVTEGKRVLGVIHLKDIVKGGIQERFAELRRMGIKTVMITGDNPLTAAAIAAEAGVDDFLAQATPEAKLKLIRDSQAGGRLVAMAGDGTNDAPALAQADVAVAMNTGTQAAKEAGNMVDLDSNPTKLIEVVKIGKQLLMTRGSLTTFSIANDVAKYFAIIPAAFALTYPGVERLEHHAFGHPPKCDPLGGHFQRGHHRLFGALGPEGREIPARLGFQTLAGQFPHVRGRGTDRAFRGHQADRHGP